MEENGKKVVFVPRNGNGGYNIRVEVVINGQICKVSIKPLQGKNSLLFGDFEDLTGMKGYDFVDTKTKKRDGDKQEDVAGWASTKTLEEITKFLNTHGFRNEI